MNLENDIEFREVGAKCKAQCLGNNIELTSNVCVCVLVCAGNRKGKGWDGTYATGEWRDIERERETSRKRERKYDHRNKIEAEGGGGVYKIK